LHRAAPLIKMPTMKPGDTPTITSHPPERRRRTEIRMCHGCCCCCCCLHTVGGIIGAGIAPAFGKNNRMPITYYYDEEDGVALPNIAKAGVSAVKVFWLLSLVAALLGALIGAALGREGFGVGLVILALVFPAVQLGSALITLAWMALSFRSDKSFQLWQIGKIILGLVVGAVVGVLAMVAFGVLMSMH
jgi:hypothetical protein